MKEGGEKRMQGCTIGDLASFFHLEAVCSSPTSIDKQIKVIEVDRPGLEMAGFFEYHQKSRLVLIGKKEIAYLQHMTEADAYHVFLSICSEETPGVIICHGLKCPPVIIQAAQHNDCAVFVTNVETSAFEADALNYLSEMLAPRTSVHANLLEIFGTGVLILGESGIGKSEVSLDLIKRGHILISDDKVDILNVRDRLEGSSPEMTYGMMEVRGIGIIDVARMFGINCVRRKSDIKYCFDLVPLEKANSNLDRIGNEVKTIEYVGVKVPYLKLPVSPGRSMAEVIEVAVTNLRLKENGFDSAREFLSRMDAARAQAQSEMENNKKD